MKFYRLKQVNTDTVLHKILEQLAVKPMTVYQLRYAIGESHRTVARIIARAKDTYNLVEMITDDPEYIRRGMKGSLYKLTDNLVVKNV